MKNLTELFNAQNLTLTINEEALTARCDRPAPRSRLGFKVEFNYRFKSVERLVEFCENFLKEREETAIAKAKYAAAKKAKAANLAAEINVGDIFVDSWGWEQTNIDLYQVVSKPSAKTLIVREIATERVEGSEMSHGMACDVRAVVGEFIGEEKKVRVNSYGGFKTSSYSSATPTTADRHHYCSWYA